MRLLKDTLHTVLLSSPTALSYKQASELLHCTEQTAGINLRRLVAENRAHVHHTSTHEKGGTPEKFFAAGPAPEGHVPPNIGLTPERLAEARQRRKELNKVYTRESKMRKRQLLRAQKTAAVYEDPLFTPNRLPTVTPYERGYATLVVAWNPNLEKFNVSA